MEFKNNRGKQIRDQMGVLADTPKQPEIPALFRDDPLAKQLAQLHNEYTRKLKELKKAIQNKKIAMLADIENDPVLTKCGELFDFKNEFGLTLESPQLGAIIQAASRRFRFGYPPRKPGDTHMGDAVNWEWIRYCCKEYERDVVIVSYDGDYGTTVGNSTYVNPHLYEEFHNFTHGKTVTLFASLSDALEHLGVNVSNEEREAEEEAEETRRHPSMFEQLRSTAIAWEKFQAAHPEARSIAAMLGSSPSDDQAAASYLSVLKDVAPSDQDDS
jgi:hypothetical protein